VAKIFRRRYSPQVARSRFWWFFFSARPGEVHIKAVCLTTGQFFHHGISGSVHIGSQIFHVGAEAAFGFGDSASFAASASTADASG